MSSQPTHSDDSTHRDGKKIVSVEMDLEKVDALDKEASRRGVYRSDLVREGVAHVLDEDVEEEADR